MRPAAWRGDLQATVSLWLPDRLGLPTEIASKRDSRLIHDRAPRGQEPTHVLLIEDDVAIAMGKQRQAEVGQAAATLDARKKQLTRLQAMAKRDAIQPLLEQLSKAAVIHA